MLPVTQSPTRLQMTRIWACEEVFKVQFQGRLSRRGTS